MKIIQCEIPERYKHSDYNASTLEVDESQKEYSDEYRLTWKLMEYIDTIWYWYVTGWYEGGGRALVLWKDKTIGYYDLGHCSCSGPIYKFFLKKTGDYMSIKDILMSDEEKEISYSIINEAKKTID